MESCSQINTELTKFTRALSNYTNLSGKIREEHNLGVFQWVTICFSGLEVGTEISLVAGVYLKLQGTLWLWLYSSIKLANLKYIQSLVLPPPRRPFGSRLHGKVRKINENSAHIGLQTLLL